MRAGLIMIAGLAPLSAACQTLASERPSLSQTDNAVGRILSYRRSNLDGTEAEMVRVFRRSAIRIEVIKTRDPCSSAAFVTAELDIVHGDAARLIGGRLLPDGQRSQEGWLDLTADGTRLEMRLGNATAAPAQSIAVPLRPWHLYDFDFATLTSAPPPEASNGRDFTFGLALSLVQPSGLDLRWLGPVNASFVRREMIGDRRVNKFEIAGSMFASQERGSMWFDIDSGAIVRAELSLPNHVEYRNFRLELVDESRGEAAWENTLRAHFANCPPS